MQLQIEHISVQPDSAEVTNCLFIFGLAYLLQNVQKNKMQTQTKY